MNELAIKQGDAGVATTLPTPRRTAIATRVATMEDLPFLDRLQKQHSKQLGFFPRAQMQGYVNGGHVLVAEVGGGGSEVGNSPPTTHDLRPTPVGYCVSRDRYLKRDELGVVYQLCVATGHQRGLIGATLVRDVFARSAYGCRLYCCWCAQDLDANYFWESLGFVPIAFRAGSTGKRRVHIFWQRRINGDDTGERATPYWYPCMTNNGAIREDRLVFPIPPGTHWTEVQAVAVASTARPALKSPRRANRTPEVGAQGGPQQPTPRPRAGAQFGAPPPISIRPAQPVILARVEKPAPATRKKPPREKIDPALAAKARELRDRCMEQVNDRLLLAPRGKYDVSRALGSNGVRPLLAAG